MPWTCPECDHINDDLLIRCVCGYETKEYDTFDKKNILRRRRLSSRTTYIEKRIMPFLLSGFLFLWLGFFLIAGKLRGPGILIIIGPVTISAIFYFVLKIRVFNLIDEVYDEGSTLLFKDSRAQVRINFSDIKNINSTYFDYSRVIVSLRNESELGSELRFKPRGGIPFKKCEHIETLIDRIDKAKAVKTKLDDSIINEHNYCRTPQEETIKRLSSKLTKLNKLISLLFLGAFGIVIFIVVFASLDGKGPPIFFTICLLATFAFGCFMANKTVFDLIDEVYDEGSALLVTKGKVQERVKLIDIKNVSYTYFYCSRAFIRLKNDTKLGTEICFKLPWRPIPYRKNLDIESLIDRIDIAKSQQGYRKKVLN